jgi:hypothetical protein
MHRELFLKAILKQKVKENQWRDFCIHTKLMFKL